MMLSSLRYALRECVIAVKEIKMLELETLFMLDE